MLVFEWFKSKLKRDLFKDEMESFTIKFHAIELLSNQMKDQIQKSEDSIASINNGLRSINELSEAHKQDIAEMKKLVELQKVHCYLITRLINSSGIEIPEDFDVTNLEHAKKLYNRYRSGDLMNY